MNTKKLKPRIMCVETKSSIASPSKLCAATNCSVPWFAPIAKEIVDAIPVRARRKTPCTKGERGLDVWLAVAGPLQAGGCDPSTVRLGTYLFSLSETMAVKYLPLTRRRVPRSVARAANSVRLHESRSVQAAA